MFRLFASLISIFLMVQVISAQTYVLRGGTLHTAEGQTIYNGIIAWNSEEILYVGQGPFTIKDAVELSGDSLHIWPGFIALCTQAGLSEIDAARPTKDQYEVGYFNPHIRSQIAYNTDSKILPTLRFNGVLFVQPSPVSGRIAGTSSIMRTWANNWEDATVKKDDAMHLNWPYLTSLPERAQNIQYEKEVKEIADFLKQAHAYQQNKPAEKDLRLESMTKVLEGKTILFIHVMRSTQVLDLIALMDQYPKIKYTLVMNNEVQWIAGILARRKIPVIIEALHRLPVLSQSAVDESYTLPKLLQDSGVKVALSLPGVWETRNLAFQAGTAAAYGLSQEEALQTITLFPAQIAGVDHKIGSLKAGKEATFFATHGDALDMKGNIVKKIWIQGKEVPVNDLQQNLFQKYQKKYNE